MLHSPRRRPDSDEVDEVLPLSEEQIPLYNGLALMPHPEQRAALVKLLKKAEKAAVRDACRLADEEDAQPATNNGKSHAFLLSSSGKNVDRVDVVPLATALWRVRMFEGGGWEARDGSEVPLVPAPVTHT